MKILYLMVVLVTLSSIVSAEEPLGEEELQKNNVEQLKEEFNLLKLEINKLNTKIKLS